MQSNIIHYGLPNWEGDYTHRKLKLRKGADAIPDEQGGGIDFSKVDFSSILTAPKEGCLTLKEAEIIHALRSPNL